MHDDRSAQSAFDAQGFPGDRSVQKVFRLDDPEHPIEASSCHRETGEVRLLKSLTDSIIPLI